MLARPSLNKMTIIDKIFKKYDKAEDVANAVSEIIKEDSSIDCEKCGEETGNKFVGDENYNYCKNCNYVTH